VIRDLVARIETGNVASAVYMAATSIAVGLLNAACMSY
jgi:putative membrane protein